MARSHGSLDDSFEDPIYGEEPFWRNTNRSVVPPSPSQGFDSAFFTGLYPPTADTAYGSGLATSSTWRNDVPGDSDPRQVPAYVNLYNTTASLDPASIQQDIQYTSSWADNQAESVAGVTSIDNQSVLSSIYECIDAPNYSASSFAYDTATDPPLSLLSEQLQELPRAARSNIGPWHPGSRDYSYPTITLSADSQPPRNLLEHGLDYNRPHERPRSVSISEPIRPPSVSSEAIGSGRSRKRFTSGKSQDNVTTCHYCGAQYTGRYRKGNCSRHVRQQHSEKSAQLALDCVCRVCKKLFARQDARRKHEWKKHRLPDTRPHSRRQAATPDDTLSYTGTLDTRSDQLTLTCTHTLLGEPAPVAHYRIPAEPKGAHDHFVSVHAELGEDVYDTYCQAILTHCGYMVEDLRKIRSDCQHAFTRLYQKLSSQLLPVQLKASGSPHPSESHADNESDVHQHHGQSSGEHRNRGKAPANKRTPHSPASFHPYEQRPSKKTNDKKTNDNPLVALAELFDPLTYFGLECPVHKYYTTHGMMSPCNGCSEDHMNGVRQHLLPSYSQQHVGIDPGDVPFMRRCGHCTEDIIDQSTWHDEGHEVSACPGRSQPRGIRVVVWLRLYLKIFPGETSVTSPFRNDPRQLPDAMVASMRDDLGLPTHVMSSFPHTQPLPQQPSVDHQADVSSATNSALLQWLNAQLEETASLQTLFHRTSHLLEQLRAEIQIQQTRNIGSIEDVEAEYRQNLGNLRQQNQAVHRQQEQHLRPHPQDTAHMATTPMSDIQHMQAPITGGADFQLPPNNQSDMYPATFPVAGSDTQPSTQSYFHSAPSFDMTPSFFSSQTDYNNPSFMFPDQPGQAAGPSHYPASTYFPESNSNQWHQYDARLEVPGSSRAHQAIAAERYPSVRRLEDDVDQATYGTQTAGLEPVPTHRKEESAPSENQWDDNNNYDPDDPNDPNDNGWYNQ